MSRRVTHLDADAFFASVEQASDPRLRHQPVAVGGEKRGIIASASYEARKYGIYTPMPTVRARRLCPKLIVLPGDFEKYERFSRWMFSYVYDFTPDVEIASIDEGYFDLTAVSRNPVEVAGIIRQAIQGALKITVSEGVGSNKLVSQIASKLYKPAAFFEVPAGGECRFLHPLANKWLPGIGPKTAERFNAAGLARIGQVAATSVDMLSLLVGSSASTLQRFARGLDDRPVVPSSAPAKSYSQQRTFDQDQTDEVFIEATLRRMADQLFAQVRADRKTVRTLTVKVRYNDMAEDQCGESLSEPTDLETDVYNCLHALLRNAWKRRVSLRLVSLKLSNLYETLFRVELPLDRESIQREARRRLASVVDGLRETRGRYVLLRGHDFVLRDSATKAAVPETPSPSALAARTGPGVSMSASDPVPLVVRSHFSFLNSTLSPEHIVAMARQTGSKMVALCDQGNLHGMIALVLAAREAGLQPVIGAEVKVRGRSLALYVQNRTGYANLCKLLSVSGHFADPSALSPAAVEGLIGISAHPELAPCFPGRFYLGISSPEEERRLRRVTGLPRVAASPVHFAQEEDRWKFEVMQSIRTLTLLRQPHPEKVLGSDYDWARAGRWNARCQGRSDYASNLEIAERCAAFRAPLGPPQFPAFQAPEGLSSPAFLRQLVLEGMRRRYVSASLSVESQLEQELQIIQEVGYEDYFLVVWDILQECRRRGIPWITRGSAADSLVCYCLGISGVCPIRYDLYFRRFLNKERMALNKLPDIDVDFPHDRKDDVVDLIFEKYGDGHCAVVGGFSTFQTRSAFAEVAKVLGVSEREVRRFTEHFPWSFGGGWEPAENPSAPKTGLTDLLRASPECRDLPLEEEPYRSALVMAEFLEGVPRYPKMHPCGVVLSRQPIHELTPTFVAAKGYPTTHLDMDAVEAVGLVKMDILAQGGLAVMRDVEAMLENRGIAVDLEHCGASFPGHRLEPPNCDPSYSDPAVWEMIASGDARAVHHIESPAMISLCRMTQVREIDGLIAIVSVIRPGAANEQKKVKFTRRYQGLEPPEYPHPSLEGCLKSTFGLVVYEEHILQICEAFAGLSPGRADVLRRALVKQNWRIVQEIGQEFAIAARARGHSPEKIGEVWELVAGFHGYAFCKAHSTAYGVEAYQSAWLKRYFPAEFMAAVLTNGKGFYHPLVYVLECHRLGIPLRPPWVNDPGPAYTVLSADLPEMQGSPAIRVPVRAIKGLGEPLLERLHLEKSRGAFRSLTDFYRRVAPSAEEMELLIQAGALDGFGGSRTAQFWEAQWLLRRFGQESSGQGWLFPSADPGLLNPGHEARSENHPLLRDLPLGLDEPTRRQRLQWETDLLGFAASGHPLELYEEVAWETYCSVDRLGRHVGEEVVTCGLVVEDRVHHQVTGEPMKFMTLCDRTGMVETELFAAPYKRYGLATVRYPVLEIAARVEPFENGRGFTLRVLHAGKPRLRKE